MEAVSEEAPVTWEIDALIEATDTVSDQPAVPAPSVVNT